MAAAGHDGTGTGVARSRMPDTFLIMAILAAAAYAAPWLFAPGVFRLGADGRIDPASYTTLGAPASAPLFGGQGKVGLIDFLFEGLVTGNRGAATVGLMAFLLVIGGAFGVIMRTGAVERALAAVLTRRKAPGEGLIVGLFVTFSLAGAVFGMGEEAIAISLILVPALVRAGYDSITGLLCCYVATQIGFGTSWINPLCVVVAQSIAGVPVLSGLEFRAVMWAVFTAAGAAFTWQHARRIRREPEASPAFASDARWKHEVRPGHSDAGFGTGDALVMLVVAAGIVWVAWGVTTRGYFLAEIAAQFMAMGIVAGIVARLFRLDGVDGNDLVRAFRDGATQLVPAVLVVGAAKGIVLLLGGDGPTHPSLLNALLHTMGGATGLLPDWATAWGMLVFQSVINLFITSGSGQAAVTMPLMAPLADLSGVTRQTAVLAFQLGDGLTHIVLPTSASLMGCLAAARLGFARWFGFAWRPMLGVFALETIFVLVAQATGYS